MSDTAHDRAENVPTTQEVRTRFADHARHLTGVGTATHERRFDRWLAAELAAAKAEALREAALDLDESTQADVNNYIGRPSPTFSHSDRYADVRWLEKRADQLEASDASSD